MVHHPDNLSSLFERGEEASVLHPQTMAQRVIHAFAAPYRIEFSEKLVVAHLRSAAAPQAVAQSGQSLARANTQLIKTQPANFVELFKTHYAIFEVIAALSEVEICTVPQDSIERGEVIGRDT